MDPLWTPMCQNFSQNGGLNLGMVVPDTFLTDLMDACDEEVPQTLIRLRGDTKIHLTAQELETKLSQQLQLPLDQVSPTSLYVCPGYESTMS